MRILSLQGGGCLGVGQAAILPYIEAASGKPLVHTFDLIAGTSVGSINGGCISANIPADTINSFFTKYAPKIFKRNPWQLAISRLFRSAKYDPAALEEALQTILGNRRLDDCEVPFIATAVDMHSGRNVFFQSYGTSYEDENEIVLAPDSGIYLWEVMRASSAAQSYFPGFLWRSYCFWDGGSTGSNAPDMLALSEATNLKIQVNACQMLSLGAGKQGWPYAAQNLVNPDLRHLMEATIHMVYSCPESNSVWQARQFLGDRHLRINPDLKKDFAIDDASQGTLASIANTWVADVQHNLKLAPFLKASV